MNDVLDVKSLNIDYDKVNSQISGVKVFSAIVSSQALQSTAIGIGKKAPA